MLQSRTYSVSINRDWQMLYDAIWQPAVFAQWAGGLAESELHAEGDEWLATSPEGPVRIRFTPYNAYGVMDHWVDPGDGTIVHVPMRIVPNGDGAEVMLTLYRQPGMTDERFAGDAKWINRDLARLKSLALRSVVTSG